MPHTPPHVCPFGVTERRYRLTRRTEALKETNRFTQVMIMYYTHIWSYDYVLYPYMVVCRSVLIRKGGASCLSWDHQETF